MYLQGLLNSASLGEAGSRRSRSLRFSSTFNSPQQGTSPQENVKAIPSSSSAYLSRKSVQFSDRQEKNRTCTSNCCKRHKNICSEAAKFLKNLPNLLFHYLAESFLIPRYRPEWGKYRTWNSKVHHRSSTERVPKITVSSSSYHTVTTEKSSKLSTPKSKSSVKKERKYKRRHVTDIPPRPVKHDHSECIPVRINVSGLVFEPQLRTLNEFPETLLGDPRRRIQYYDPDRNEYFFDRHRSCFEAIIYYYSSGGILRRPHAVSLDTFVEEIKFFDLGHKAISRYQPNEANNDDDIDLPENLLKRKLWLLFDCANSSYQSRIVACVSVLAVCLSIFEFCIETLPHFSIVEEEEEREDKHDEALSIQDPFFFTETMCIIFFTAEYIARAVTSPHFFNFLKDASNLIDLVSIMPYFLNILFYIDDHVGGSGASNTTKLGQRTISLTIFRIIRLVRVFRILKLSRHNRGLKILGKTLKASFRELCLLIFFLCVGVVIFSSAIYFAEVPYENTDFDSIPSGFWFGVVTMTTLGYGDVVPKGTLGKIIGAFCAIAGVLTISLPVPVIVSNFNMFYNTEEDSLEAAAEHRSIQYEHVKQCPYYPAWYSSDGQVIGEKTSMPKGAQSGKWLTGEQRPDLSDSDFDDLLQDAERRHGSKLKRRKQNSHLKKKQYKSKETLRSKN